MNHKVIYIVKSSIERSYDDEFNSWYNEEHILEIKKRSECILARRFQRTEVGDKSVYLAIYEFSDMETYLRYEGSQAKKELAADFVNRFGSRAKLSTSVWKQAYP